jgi:hypothetical protein
MVYGVRLDDTRGMTMGTLAKISEVGEYVELKILELLQKLNGALRS